jgi:spermidine/putrescine-binding protein
VLFAAACGGSTGSDDGGQSPAPGVGERPFEGRTLTVAAWSGPYARSFEEQIVPAFEAASGAKVQIVEEWGEIVDKIISAPADAPPFDVTVGEGYVMCYGLANDAFQKVRWDEISRKDQIFPAFMSADEVDRCEDDAYGVPFGYGYEVLGFRKDLLGFTPSSWADLWRPEVQGKIGLDQGFFNYALAPAAFVEGIDPSSLSAEGPDADAVFSRMKQLDVRLWYSSGAQLVNALKTGDVAIAEMYIEDAQRLKKEDPRFDFVIPKEGAMGWVDYYLIVRGTPNEDLANAFLDFLLDPQIQTTFSREHWYWMSNENYQPPADAPAGLFPSSNQELKDRMHLFNYDVWLPHFFDEDGFYTRFSTEILGQ